MQTPEPKASTQSNSAVERALTILELISAKDSPVSLAEVSQELGIAKSTTHRIMEALKIKGFIELVEGTEKYQVGLKAIEVGMSSLTKWNLVDIVTPYLRQLALDLNETAFLAVYDNGDVVYLYKAEANQSVRTTAELGTRKPIHSTGLGKAIVSTFHIEEVDRVLTKKGMPKFTERTITDRQAYLEELSHVRQNGYSMDDEEAEVGLTCIAVPIFNYTGKAIAAISVAGPTDRMVNKKEEVIDSLKSVNGHISNRLGFVPAMRINV
ncbi:IclR family transcriptional regulator [Halobacillus shinanisalinarum]|uniref:IclR family transcriptional regulator n=1 Tax=Halobacillus shinanisalinarum TaxID=2932258 RepID=A0ABY4GYT8_9BACI|nr:IclR family transcriptional regulator [Halobacillus shinanisalinarum]UOQ93356.1 IclR family transcriptional regulator [Halobacillus shinanisalinarum]